MLEKEITATMASAAVGVYSYSAHFVKVMMLRNVL